MVQDVGIVGRGDDIVANFVFPAPSSNASPPLSIPVYRHPSGFVQGAPSVATGTVSAPLHKHWRLGIPTARGCSPEVGPAQVLNARRQPTHESSHCGWESHIFSRPVVSPVHVPYLYVDWLLP